MPVGSSRAPPDHTLAAIEPAGTRQITPRFESVMNRFPLSSKAMPFGKDEVGSAASRLGRTDGSSNASVRSAARSFAGLWIDQVQPSAGVADHAFIRLAAVL